MDTSYEQTECSEYATRPSLVGLVRSLSADAKTFLRQELQLAKTEVIEKLAMMGRNAAGLAVGGFVAYAGLIVLLIGLGYIVAYGFEKAGLEPALANFLGLAIIGLVVAGIGGALVMKGIKAFSKESLAPERTLTTLQELRTTTGTLKATRAAEKEEKEHEPKFSSAELQAQVRATENRMGESLDELGRRLSPRHINDRMRHKIAEHPYRNGLMAAVVGAVSGLALRWKTNHNHH